MGAKQIDIKTNYVRVEIAESIQMPHSIELEEVVLGCILSGGKHVMATVARILGMDREVFYKEEHQTIYSAVLKLYEKSGSDIDMVTVLEKLKHMGLYVADASKIENDDSLSAPAKNRLLKYGVGPMDVTSLTNKASGFAQISTHAGMLRSYFMRRKAIEEAHKVIACSQNDEHDIYELYQDVAKTFRANNPTNVLRMQTMDEVMDEGAAAPPARWICGNLIKEREVAIIYGDAGTGKSVFAFQIADVASKGEQLFDHIDFRNECGPKQTIFFDFELESSEVYSRYSTQHSVHEFSDQLHRCSINPDFLDFDDADQLITNEIQQVVETMKPELVFIDNITYITAESTDPSIATKLMKRLLALQKAYSPLTIVVIAHTPKRDMSMPIEDRHLSGARNLSNFAKTLVAVSRSRLDPDFRYIKHVKCRNGRMLHGEDNVIECMIGKEGDFLGYELRGFATEASHLEVKDFSEVDTEMVEYAIKLRRQGSGWRTVAKEIKRELGISIAHTTIMRKVQDHQKKDDWLGDGEGKEEKDPPF